MTRLFFALGSIAAFIAVAAGAFAAHALEARIAPDRLDTWQLGARYQMYHALALLAVAWATTRWPAATTTAAGWLFVAGILIFSGSLYALALGAPRWFGAITPIGGLSFLAAWLLLTWTALRPRPPRPPPPNRERSERPNSEPKASARTASEASVRTASGTRASDPGLNPS